MEKTIGITGITGFLGWHLRCFLNNRNDVKILPATRETFSSPESLDQFVSSCDAIVHLAGMNRGNDEQILETNISLAQKLVDSMERTNTTPQIVFASSIHVFYKTAYGESKKRAGEIFQAWSNRTKGAFCTLIFPHLFGEGGRPFYNSALATFCHQIANKEMPTIYNDPQLELVHAQKASEIILNVIETGKRGNKRVQGTTLTVSTLLARLYEIAETYEDHIIPSVSDDFDKALFNTYRSYLYPSHYPQSYTFHQDHRGALFEAQKSVNGGQTFISTTKPTVTRGNHYHLHKVERFVCLQGKCKVQIRKLFSDKIDEFVMDGETPQFIDIPTMHTHNLINIGEETLLMLFWTDSIFDPTNPDTYHEEV